MSDPMLTTIYIGGTISMALIKTLVACLNEDFYNTNGNIMPSNIQDFIEENNILSLSGTVNNGDCETSVKFCKEHNLPYKIHNESYNDCEALIFFKYPEMDKEYSIQADNNQHPVIRLSEIKPYLDKCLNYIKTQQADKAAAVIENEINNFFPPNTINLPPFIITK